MWQFCSAEEGQERERENDVHSLERSSSVLGKLDPRLAVRKFVRSDGTNRHSLYPRRSTAQLEATVRHLLGLWVTAATATAGVSEAYSFVMDRLAAVKQELSVYAAETPASDRLRLLVPLCRFYIGSLAHCSREPASWFDATLHECALQGCLSSALAALPLCAASSSGTSTDFVRDELEACGVALQLQATLRATCSRVPSVPALVSALSAVRLPFLEGRRHQGGEGQDLVWSVLGGLRSGSVSRAIALIRASPSPPTRLASLSLLLSCCLPALQTLRLGLADCAANKGEALGYARLAVSLGVHESTVEGLAELWGRRDKDGQGGFVLRPKGEAEAGAGRLQSTLDLLSKEGASLHVADFCCS